MHWRKARLFGDAAVTEAILAEPDPVGQKALGRTVAGFAADAWAAVARDVVFRGNTAKFSQHPDLLERLRQTQGTTLVEARRVTASGASGWPGTTRARHGARLGGAPTGSARC